MTRITGTSHGDVCTCVISRRILLKMENASDQSCRENENTHFMVSNFFLAADHAVYEIMWGKCCRAGEATDDTVTRRLRVACLISKATNTHSEYVILLLHGNSDYAMRPSVTLHVYCSSSVR